MTFTQISDYINARWGDIISPKRLPVLDRQVASVIVSEMYSDLVDDSNTTETYTTKEVANSFAYSLAIHKSGNSSKIRLSFRNSTTSLAVGSVYIFTWKDTPYKPESTAGDVIAQCWNGSNRATVRINSDGVFLISSLLPTSTLFTSTFEFYIAQE